MNPHDTPNDVTEGMEAGQLSSQITNAYNETYSALSKMLNLRYVMLIYRLLKRGYVTPAIIAECADTTRPNVYRMVDDFEKYISSVGQS